MKKLIQYATKASFYDGPFGEDGHPWIAAGMGYVMETPAGELIAVDGGTEEDRDGVLRLIEDMWNGDGVPTVALWVLTHPHPDHFGALGAIAEMDGVSSRLNVKTVAARFPEDFNYNAASRTDKALATLAGIVQSFGAELKVPCIGDVLYVGDTEVKFYFAPEDISEIHGPNPLSLIFSVRTDASRILFTGDAYWESLRSTAERWGDELSSDVLQMPHHGLCDTGSGTFYRAVGARTLMIPTCTAGDRAMERECYEDAMEANRTALEMASRVYKACDGTAEIELK